MKKIYLLLIITILLTGCSFNKKEEDNKPYVYVAETIELKDNKIPEGVTTYKNIKDAYKATDGSMAAALLLDDKDNVIEKYIVVKYKNNNYYIKCIKKYLYDEATEENEKEIYKAYVNNEQTIYNIFDKDDECRIYSNHDEIACDHPYRNKAHLSAQLFKSGKISVRSDNYVTNYDEILDRISITKREDL